jgi:hypothetical protein
VLVVRGIGYSVQQRCFNMSRCAGGARHWIFSATALPQPHMKAAYCKSRTQSHVHFDLVEMCDDCGRL